MMMDRTRSHRSVYVEPSILTSIQGSSPGVEPYPEDRQVGAHPPYSVPVSIDEESERPTLCAVQGAEPPTVVRSGKCEKQASY